jgi:tetratricopeptide (TPR) repeat protein
MTSSPQFFTLPVERFDPKLLPPQARQLGSPAFNTAVVAYFAAQYAAEGQQAVVSVDDGQISVLVLPAGAQPLDFLMTLLQSGRIKEAVPYLEAIAKAGPADAQVFYNLGIAYSELRQFDEAVIRLKRAVQLDPQHAHAWTGIGVAYQRMGKPDRALGPMQRAVQADPSDGYARRNLGALLLGEGRSAEALEQFRAARKALPHDAQTLYGLACALDALGGQDNLQEADDLYQVVIAKFPGAHVAELSREARTKLAAQDMRARVGGGLRPDVISYLSAALETFGRVGPEKAKQITFEIASKGQNGLDIHDPEQKYTLSSLPGAFSGMQLVSIMYAGIKALDPAMDAGIDLDAEYEVAKAMRSQ